MEGTSIPLRSTGKQPSRSTKVSFGVELLARMRLRPSVNWSEVCRRAVRSLLDEMDAADKRRIRRVANAKKRRAAGRPAPFTDLAAKLHRLRPEGKNS